MLCTIWFFIHNNVLKYILMKNCAYILLLMLIFALSSTVSAQIEVPSTTDINIELIPSSPKPNELVSASITSYSTDINSAKITWSVNGKTQKSGVGEKGFIFNSGDTGTTNIIYISVKTKEGELIERSLTVSPVSVDLIWQNDSFVPPFYKGKALYSHQNKITFIALPHIFDNGKEVSPKNLIYTWKKNGSVVDSASGYGKNTYTTEGSVISRTLNIEVNVTSPTTNAGGYAHTIVTPIEPSIVFYKKNPLYGIEFQTALSGAVNIKNSNEINILAVPFFFGVTDKKSIDLTYIWSINGSEISNTGSSNQVFRKKEGTEGNSFISLSIENSNKILQYASADFNLVFNNKSSL